MAINGKPHEWRPGSAEAAGEARGHPCVWDSGGQGAFGCKGYRISSADQLAPVLREALAQPVPVLIEIPIDYSQNLKLMQDVHQDFIH